MKVQNLEDLMYVGMTYVLDFEKQIAQEAGKMAQAASDPEVKDVFEKTVSKSNQYAERVQSAFQKLGRPQDTNQNQIAKAMVEEVENMISNTEAGPVRDAALIVAFNQQQAYRVASYGSLSHYAELSGKSDAVSQLQQSVDDAKAGDEKLTQIGEQNVNRKAAQQPVAA